MKRLTNLKTIVCLIAFFSALTASAQIPSNYYSKADGKKGAALKTAMCGIIYTGSNPGYKALLELYHTSDKRADGKLWDMYSSTTNYVIGGPAENHQYSKEGDGYNREHSVPQSWFNEQAPMKSDGFHVVPTDGYVNNRRSNYPYGEVGSATYSSNNNFSRLGSCTTTGYSGTVFEPNDEYKGDFARIYFYMVTCYENKCTSWSGGIFANTKYPGLAEWQLNMLLRWAKDDPVSQKEIDRNNAVYEHQGNRNPFVDYPGLEQYIWGTEKNTQFSYNDYIVPSGYGTWTPGGDDGPGGGDDGPGGGDDGPGGGDETGDYCYALVKSTSDLKDGDKIILVYEDKSVVMAEQGTNNRAMTSVTITDHKIASLPDRAELITLEGSEGAWYFHTAGGYLYAASSSSNYLRTEDNADDNAKATISINSNTGDAVIEFQGNNSHNVLQYNISANIFSCYTGSQKDLQIYKNIENTTSIEAPESQPLHNDDAFFNLSGQRVDRSYKGVVIHNGRKYVLR